MVSVNITDCLYLAARAVCVYMRVSVRGVDVGSSMRGNCGPGAGNEE